MFIAIPGTGMHQLPNYFQKLQVTDDTRYSTFKVLTLKVFDVICLFGIIDFCNNFTSRDLKKKVGAGIIAFQILFKQMITLLSSLCAKYVFISYEFIKYFNRVMEPVSDRQFKKVVIKEKLKIVMTNYE